MVKIRYIILFTCIVNSLSSSDQKSITRYTNNSSILGQYIDNLDIQKIITDYFDFYLFEIKTIDTKENHLSIQPVSDGKHIAFKSWDARRIRILNLETSRFTETLNYDSIFRPWLESIAGLTSKVSTKIAERLFIGLHLSNNGKLAAVHSSLWNSKKEDFALLEIYDTHKNSLLGAIKFQVLPEYVHVKFSNNGKYIASISLGRTDDGEAHLLKIFNIETFPATEIKNFSLPAREYYDIEFFADDKNLALIPRALRCQFAGNLLLFNDFKNISKSDEIKKIYLNSDVGICTTHDKYIITSYGVNKIKIHDEYGRQLDSLDEGPKYFFINGLNRTFFEPIALLALSNNSKYLATYVPGLIKIWDLKNKDVMQDLKTQVDKNYDRSLFFSSDDNYLILKSDRLIFIWQTIAKAITQGIEESNSMRNTLCSVQ